jgi:hypothetical protein
VLEKVLRRLKTILSSYIQSESMTYHPTTEPRCTIRKLTPSWIEVLAGVKQQSKPSKDKTNG